MIRASHILFWFGLTIAASLALYHTSDRVHVLDKQLHDLNARIAEERQSLHVLKAEWVYLANPARIEAAAKKYLAMRPTSPQQVTRLEDLADMLPTRSEAMASVAVTATPMATIKSNLAALTPPAPLPKPRAVKLAKAVTAAVADKEHVNDHMIMQRTASAQPLPDSIGSLISELGSHP